MLQVSQWIQGNIVSNAPYWAENEHEIRDFLARLIAEKDDPKLTYEFGVEIAFAIEVEGLAPHWKDAVGQHIKEHQAPKALPKKYIVHPGPVRSRNDGQWHHISASQLMNLYGVLARECIVKQKPDDTLGIDESQYIHLHPRGDGDYSLPTKKGNNR